MNHPAVPPVLIHNGRTSPGMDGTGRDGTLRDRTGQDKTRCVPVTVGAAALPTLRQYNISPMTLHEMK